MKNIDITPKHLDSIEYDKKRPNFKIQGNSDPDGVQIFTPQFIVKDMVSIIDSKDVINFTKTILEPTSGDGAFTCYILQIRLNSIKSNINILAETLRAISTIYSIEMDLLLVKEQRNNLYSITLNFLNAKGIEITDTFKNKLKRIILCNVIWGETNIDYPIKFADDPIGWYIKDNKTIKKSSNRIQFARWIIDNKLNSESVFEDWESNTDLNTKQLGGIFGD
jgi:hypothetical protein